MSLAGRAGRGALVTVGAQATRFGTQVAAVAVLSRLLEPAVFGQMAVVLVVVGFAGIVGDLGLSLSAMQSTELRPEEEAGLFWTGVVIGIVLGASLFVLGPVVVSSLGMPQAGDPMRTMGLLFVLSGASAQYKARLARSMRFTALAAAEVSAQALGLVAAVLGAAYGVGVWALVMQHLVGAVALLALLALVTRWVPGGPMNVRFVRKHLAFGAPMTALQLLNFAGSSSGTVMIGRIWGDVVLGVYNRAFQLFMLPMQQMVAPLTRVAVPVLAKAAGSPNFGSQLLRLQASATYPLIFILSLIGGMAGSIVSIALGSGWSGAATVVSVLVIGGVFQALGYVYYWALVAAGEVRTLFVCEAIGRILMILASVLVAPFGIVWVAAAHSMGLIVVWLAMSLGGVRRINVSSGALLQSSWRPVLLGAMTFAATGLLEDWASGHAVDAFGTLVLGLCAGLGLAAAFAVFAPFRRDYRVVFGVLEGALRRRRA
ncbi:lipopolysaccharide biosynthesis protein [Actinotalea sp. JY-7876]|uniref:lipopolysaccharide biosynthesis protein n=1 Tax=Actinotalea sp. JY-7876 TaxID=2758442 RepID=UPI0015F63867|nr:lipopolysaccharide biosynthesis protein [Actinotalea sp. JY-7876]